MKLNLLRPYCIAAISLLISCKGQNKADHADSIKNNNGVAQKVKIAAPTDGPDSTALTTLTRNLYKWHETDTMKYDGFKPLKAQASDTLFTSIDLNENGKAIEELKKTGLFTDSFLNNYRKIAVRMDKELRDGSSLWPDGEISTFGHDSDEWCNCQDFPVDNYWNTIKLTDIKINGNEANFKWTWGGDFYYTVRAIKEAGSWKISYLQGFDMNTYSWEWWKKNKNKKS